MALLFIFLVAVLLTFFRYLLPNCHTDNVRCRNEEHQPSNVDLPYLCVCVCVVCIYSLKKKNRRKIKQNEKTGYCSSIQGIIPKMCNKNNDEREHREQQKR